MKTFIHNKIVALIAITMVAVMPAPTLAADLYYGDNLGSDYSWDPVVPSYDAYDYSSDYSWDAITPSYDYSYDYGSDYSWDPIVPSYDYSNDYLWDPIAPSYDYMSDYSWDPVMPSYDYSSDYAWDPIMPSYDYSSDYAWDPIMPSYDYSSDYAWDPIMPSYDYSSDYAWDPIIPSYDYASDVSSWSTPSISAPFYSNTNNYAPSFSARTISTPRYTTGGSTSRGSTGYISTPSFSVNGASAPRYSTGGANIASVGGANIIHAPTYTQPVVSQPIVINNQPAQAQPITITNNNVNTNVNTNTNPAPVYTAPTYVAPAPALQCSAYATASAYKGAKVTLSWATSGGNNTQVVCDGNALSNQTVSAVSSLSIYPSKSTTCYVTVRSNVDTKTCSVYVPVQEYAYVAPQPTYIAPAPTYTAPVVMQPVAPHVSVESAHIPVYKSIKLTETPYTGFEDYLYPMFLAALALTGAYVAMNRRRLLKLA